MSINVEDSITININGKAKAVTMYFGLLNEIAKKIPDIEMVGDIMGDPTMREEVMKILLAERNDEGEVTKAFNPITANITLADANKLLVWTTEHMLGFLMASLQEAKKISEANAETVKALMSSSTGTAS